jgi:hypothetical protein
MDARKRAYAVTTAYERCHGLCISTQVRLPRASKFREITTVSRHAMATPDGVDRVKKIAGARS